MSRMKTIHCYPACCCISFIIFLAAGASTEETRELSCLYDTFSTLFCTWIYDHNYMNATCRLTATVDKHQGYCNLTANGNNPRSCELPLLEDRQKPAATVSSKISLLLQCLLTNQTNVTVKKLQFMPYENLRVNPPTSLQIVNISNGRAILTWVCHTYHYTNGKLNYEVCYRPFGESPKTLDIKQDQQWVELVALESDTVYEVQVRARVAPNHAKYKGQWSGWSKTLEWQTPPADPAQVFSHPVGMTLVHVLWIVGICLAVAISGAVFITGFWKTNWFRRFSWFSVPDPSMFFEPALSLQGGDFKTWLSSPFPVAAFDPVDAAPKISLVEIAPKKVTPKNDAPSTLLNTLTGNIAQLENSGHSLCSFLNQGYFLSHGMDTCKVYFTYETLEVSEEEDSSSNGDGSYLALPSPDALDLHALDFHTQLNVDMHSSSGTDKLASLPDDPGASSPMAVPFSRSGMKWQNEDCTVSPCLEADLNGSIQNQVESEGLARVESVCETGLCNTYQNSGDCRANNPPAPCCSTCPAPKLGGNTGEYLSLKDMELQYG
ncbi:interleukin-2 receptor subunit beta [Ambystoma mexicanum]|uniref:interleukin-2 receptor subunit beta n=1 Tax=Ambystoma mexicanum TaxID=8296 RepID=UPI0037E9A5BE